MSTRIVFPRLVLPLERLAARELAALPPDQSKAKVRYWRSTGWQLRAMVALLMFVAQDLTLWAICLTLVDLLNQVDFARRVIDMTRYVIYAICAFGLLEAYMLMIEERVARRILATAPVTTDREEVEAIGRTDEDQQP